MKAALLDEQGAELTEITSHVGGSPDHMLVDRATRPDVLFQYYFDRGRRSVTAVIGAARLPAILDTRWQMGARCWFLRELFPGSVPADAPGSAPSARDSRCGEIDGQSARQETVSQKGGVWA